MATKALAKAVAQRVDGSIFECKQCDARLVTFLSVRVFKEGPAIRAL